MTRILTRVHVDGHSLRLVDMVSATFAAIGRDGLTRLLGYSNVLGGYKTCCVGEGWAPAWS
jgi:hypothetical protein